MRKPDFNNLLQVLDRKKPSRLTLFEFFFNEGLNEKLAGDMPPDIGDGLDHCRKAIAVFRNAGYDYAILCASDFRFQSNEKTKKVTRSLNDANVISDEESFRRYAWPDPRKADLTRLDRLTPSLPEGMKFIINEPDGVLENVTNLVGYDNLCVMLYDDTELAEELFARVGETLLAYYALHIDHPSVGAILCNDDWGFHSQTLLSPEHMRKYIFPWYKKIVDLAHRNGKPAILHSCGNMRDVMEDIISMGFDGKHSFEDKIMPVEEFYDQYAGRIAVLGGIDIDFLCRETPEAIQLRCRNMLARSEEKGSYALGTGNSVPFYMPDENFMALLETVR